MSGTEAPDFDRLTEAREIAHEAKEDRREIYRLKNENEILIAALGLAKRDLQDALAHIDRELAAIWAEREQRR